LNNFILYFLSCFLLFFGSSISSIAEAIDLSEPILVGQTFSYGGDNFLITGYSRSYPVKYCTTVNPSNQIGSKFFFFNCGSLSLYTPTTHTAVCPEPRKWFETETWYLERMEMQYVTPLQLGGIVSLSGKYYKITSHHDSYPGQFCSTRNFEDPKYHDLDGNNKMYLSRSGKILTVTSPVPSSICQPKCPSPRSWYWNDAWYVEETAAPNQIDNIVNPHPGQQCPLVPVE